ncbi:receptor-binding cancer antigen expressed on SiSo cells-like [Xenia sp. Carnegie-2017]|uniref:receptor-binding cancer antigen expressed on SiSo cells-like n=1 Tax=Xenia sp. Carnegie-2017 TaxID=2897299 RepID=UPI001F034310|nr:receptor-binding cancer antigen expressed on SiSo cells-like [Xenia sp. Carnegie-2017]
MKISTLFSWIFAFIKFIQRCICGRKQLNNENSTRSVSKQPYMTPSKDDDLTSWDDWGKNDNELVSVKVEAVNGKDAQQEQKENEVDLFGDMQPIFQKPKKIRLKRSSPEENISVKQSSDRLKFDSSTAIPGTELGTWTEDCDAWEEVGDDEIEWETQNVLKETRQAERERRALEQQKRKEERDAARIAKKTSGNFGVRLN